jgi:hypothetical protein
MKIIRVLTLFFLIFYTTIASAQMECCKYKIFALKHDMRGHVGIDVGSIGTNNFYTGIQGTIPLSSFSSTDEYYMNTSLGFGLDYFKKSKIIVTGIVGLHTADKFNTIGTKNINIGAGLTVLSDNTIVVGFSFTNKEKFAAKIGFYLY